ncbi:MAG: hypothetical protein N2652_04435 [Kiritimatiellae bacterium]|nr:hypothetical protein [Kiritimatiellia bacterium]
MISSRAGLVHGGKAIRAAGEPRRCVLQAGSVDITEPCRRAVIAAELEERLAGRALVLNTCQRLEWYGATEPAELAVPGRRWAGVEAFERLARIAAGLESRLLGELEILGQVREAYRRFREQGGADATELDRIFQDALALARRARRESRIDESMTSLATLAVRRLLDEVSVSEPIGVIGSGSLATSVARRLARQGAVAIRVAGRCPENALRVAAQCGGFAGGLDSLSSLLDGVRGIVCATAAPHPVLYARHLAGAGRPLLIVDLGAPPDCAADVAGLEEVRVVPLREIEAMAQTNLEERRRRAEIAARVIAMGAREWAAAR